MPTTVSADGTTLGYTRTGSGPALVLVDGALCFRGSTPNDAIANELADRFTVYTYDRRGRGESGDTQPYDVEREVEDVAALVKEAGGEAGLFGISSGAALALEAAHRGVPVNRVAVYEPPFVVDGSRKPLGPEYAASLDTALENGKPGEAVRIFMRVGVGLPAPMVAMMGLMPAWPKLKRVAHTLPYDVALMDGHQSGRPLPEGRWSGLTAPSLVIDGGKSPKWMRAGCEALAKNLAGATYRTLPGQTHLVKAKALAPVLAEFFTPR
ncbi:alpha/beta fold hydrolase [Amycolatopsis sp. NPDC051903]|uniref:alpha/beta fold hydrolase n=1 Tax=Amycolatopsis sp. NPDC051903 TaxID=3363936 RepID=UPI0037A002A2